MKPQKKVYPLEKSMFFNSNDCFAFVHCWVLALCLATEDTLFRHGVASRGKGLCRMESTVVEMRQTTRTHPTTSTRRNLARTQLTAIREGRIVGWRPGSPRPTHGRSSSRKEHWQPTSLTTSPRPLNSLLFTTISTAVMVGLEAFLPFLKIPTRKLKMHHDISVVATFIEYCGS